MISIKEYLALKDNDVVAIGRKYYVAKGKNDLKEPRLLEKETGEVLSGAIYAVHLMVKCGTLDEVDARIDEKIRAENAEKAEKKELAAVKAPAKRAIARKEKAMAEPKATVENAVSAPAKRRGRPPKVRVSQDAVDSLVATTLKMASQMYM